MARVLTATPMLATSWNARRRRRTRVRSRRRTYLTSTAHHFMSYGPTRRTRRNPAASRGGFNMTWLLLGGAAFLFLMPQGRAMMSSLTSGLTRGGVVRQSTNPNAPGYVPPSGSANLFGVFASMVPAVTQTISGWIRGLSDTSSVTTPGVIYGWGGPIPPIPDLTLGSPGGILTSPATDFWSQFNTSGLWGNTPVVAATEAGILPPGVVPTLDLSLSSPWTPLPDVPPLPVDTFGTGFMGVDGLHTRAYGHLGVGVARTKRLPPSYR